MDGSGREVASGLHRIEAPLAERYVACYVIVGNDAALLFDTGVEVTPAGSMAPYRRAAGIAPADIRWVVVSHADVDHMGGDAAAKELLPGASLVAYRGDQLLIEDVEALIEQRYREFRDGHGIDLDPAMLGWCRVVARAAPIDVALEGSMLLDLGGRQVRILHTPGHSDGSISIWDPMTWAALSSDAVLGESVHLADGRPAFPPTYRRPRPHLESIAAIEALAPALLLTAHEPVMEADAAAGFLARSRSFTDDLGAAALRALAEAAQAPTTSQLIERLAPQMGDWVRSAWMFLANGLVGQLEEWAAEGVVVAEPGPPIRWRLEPGRHP